MRIYCCSLFFKPYYCGPWTDTLEDDTGPREGLLSGQRPEKAPSLSAEEREDASAKIFMMAIKERVFPKLSVDYADGCMFAVNSEIRQVLQKSENGALRRKLELLYKKNEHNCANATKEFTEEFYAQLSKLQKVDPSTKKVELSTGQDVLQAVKNGLVAKVNAVVMESEKEEVKEAKDEVVVSQPG